MYSPIYMFMLRILVSTFNYIPNKYYFTQKHTITTIIIYFVIDKGEVVDVVESKVVQYEYIGTCRAVLNPVLLPPARCCYPEKTTDRPRIGSVLVVSMVSSVLDCAVFFCMSRSPQNIVKSRENPSQMFAGRVITLMSMMNDAAAAF